MLDRFVVDCDAVVTDDGYPPFTNPEYHDYRERTPQCETVRLAVPDIPNRELLPLSISDRVRAIESLQNDTPRALMEAHEDDDGSGDGFYATRQKIFFRCWDLRPWNSHGSCVQPTACHPPLLNTGTEKNALRKNSGTMTDSA